ncbi:hypothetical protein [Pyrodictium delaneyi]|uniref:Uncharacterized protein n=1 Tax=Pyrodictium delaneyi TaxID=1273541 RepID=A0A211YM51_9CREN|nr:hypothetical protein [Pyrodictium delaneyi]OWJ54133.1 hypothetical protein Pdsh_09800 [Pyrodictium delaneyi]
MKPVDRIAGDDVVELETLDTSPTETSKPMAINQVAIIPRPRVVLEVLDETLPQPSKLRIELPGLETIKLEKPILLEPERRLPETSIDPLEALFGTSRLRVYSERPLLVLARKPLNMRYDYIELLKRVLREIYRVSWRAPLYTQHVARRLTEYQLAMMRAGAAIYVVDLDELAGGEAETERITTSSRVVKSLEDRAREAYAQGFGFLVLYASQYMLQNIQRLWEPRLASRGLLYTRLPPPLELSIVEDDAVFDLVATMYGLEPSDIQGASSLVDAIIMAEHRYYSFLEAFANDPTLALLSRPPVDDEETRPDEGFIHYAFKMAVVSYLLEAGFDERSIDVEVRTSSSIALDIMASRGWSSVLVVEVETLYGTGNPVVRLSSVVRDRLAMGYSVWIVIPPFQASIYAPQLLSLLRKYDGIERVEFYTLDMSSGSLVSLEEHIKKLETMAARLVEVKTGSM